MLGRSKIPDKSFDPDEPGPGHYILPDQFNPMPGHKHLIHVDGKDKSKRCQASEISKANAAKVMEMRKNNEISPEMLALTRKHEEQYEKAIQIVN